MSIPKFFSWRDKRTKSRNRSSPAESPSREEETVSDRCWNIFCHAPIDAGTSRQIGSRALQQQIKDLKRRLEVEADYRNPSELALRYALLSRYSCCNIEKAFELILIIQNSIDGVIEPIVPTRKLLGAVNRAQVTCYLDSLLFAMFARHRLFDAILYPAYDDEDRHNLIVLLRLWVNMLRLGKLIPIDITMLLQNALAKCGWPEAALRVQQDASEAFTFIADKLDLPLVTLKMDLFHAGKEDLSSDHRFVNERLLQVSIPPEPDDGRPILLEDCLESYFNDRIEVRRYLDRQDTQDTLTMNGESSSGAASKGPDPEGKVEISHVEAPRIGRRASSGTDITLLESPSELPSEFPSELKEFEYLYRPSMLHRTRTSSIVRRRFIPDPGIPKKTASGDERNSVRNRKGSIRKEVMMPAWAMFSLIPWYTENNTDVFQTAMHFSEQRPILGICLKRYSFLPNGKAIRLGTKIDIPTEISLPHFIKDDDFSEEDRLYGRFKLVLQSAVCHKGSSIDSGHYIALVRGPTGPAIAMSDHDSSSGNDSPNSKGSSPSSGASGSTSDRSWLRFDDLADERITLIDIEEALRTETPYVLFYQILPLDEDPDERDPPEYSEPEPSVASLLAAAGLSKTPSGSSGRDSRHDSAIIVSGAESSRRDPSPDRSRPATADTETGSTKRNSASFIKGLSLLPRTSSSENIMQSARTYFSRKKSTDPVAANAEKEGDDTGSNQASLELKRGRAKEKSPRTQSSERPNGSEPSRTRAFLKKSGRGQHAPERECIIM